MESNEVRARTLKKPYEFGGEKGYPFRLFLKDLQSTGRQSASIRRSEIRLYDLYKYWVSADLDAATFGLQEGILYIQKLDKELTTGGREEAITKVRAFCFICASVGYYRTTIRNVGRNFLNTDFSKAPKYRPFIRPKK